MTIFHFSSIEILLKVYLSLFWCMTIFVVVQNVVQSVQQQIGISESGDLTSKPQKFIEETMNSTQVLKQNQLVLKFAS